MRKRKNTCVSNDRAFPSHLPLSLSPTHALTHTHTHIHTPLSTSFRFQCSVVFATDDNEGEESELHFVFSSRSLFFRSVSPALHPGFASRLCAECVAAPAHAHTSASVGEGTRVSLSFPMPFETFFPSPHPRTSFPPHAALCPRIRRSHCDSVARGWIDRRPPSLCAVVSAECVRVPFSSPSNPAVKSSRSPCVSVAPFNRCRLKPAFIVTTFSADIQSDSFWLARFGKAVMDDLELAVRATRLGHAAAH